MRTWTIRYKWASGEGVAMPRGDIHGGHEAVKTLRTPGGNVAPTRGRVERAIVADLYKDRAHGHRFGWRIARRISVLPVGTVS